MATWSSQLKGDPLPWLLANDAPAVRHLALRHLLDRPADDPEVRAARAAAMESAPIATILAAQDPAGFWVRPGPGYGPKYTGTVWQVIFLDQLGADGTNPRVRAGCAYVLAHSQSATGGFAASGRSTEDPPAPSSAIHCLHGNLLRALLGFGWFDDERVQRALDWQARSITGDGFTAYYQSGTSGPGFRCAANRRLPCAWGAVKALGALTRVPVERRSEPIERAIQDGVQFLLSCEPSTALYPAGGGQTRPSPLWFKMGFPSGYVADVLQNLEVLCELGLAGNPRLQQATAWLTAQQDERGRWTNGHAYTGRTWIDIERQGQPSKWVTLRACRVLKAVSMAHHLEPRRHAPSGV